MAKPVFLELGATGLRQTGGFVYDEFLSKLVGYQGAKVYREMQDNDPVVGAVLFAISMLVRGAPMHFQAVDDSSAALEAKDFAHQVYFEDMEHTWSDFMAETASMLTFGYSIAEQVFKVRKGPSKDPRQNSKFTDGKIGIRKLAPRAQETVWRWVFDPDSGDAVAFEQYLIDRPNVTIPLDKCLHFKTTSSKNNPEGRSVLRPAYIPYLRKKTLEDAEGRAAMRSAGVVVLELPVEYFDPTEDEQVLAMMAQFRAAATALAQDRQGSLLLPSTRDDHGNASFNLRYVTADSRRSGDMSPVIERLDKRIAMTVLADFILLGQQSAGSFALSGDKTDMFERAIETFLTSIVDTVNRDSVTKLWQYNGLPEELQPQLKHGGVKVPNIEQLGNFISKLAGAGATLFPNDELQDYMLRVADLPVTSDTTSD